MSTGVTFLVSSVKICAYQRIPPWTKGHCSSQCFFEHGDSYTQRLFQLPCPSLSCHCFISVAGVFLFCVGVFAWVARIYQPWEQSLSTVVGASCQQWKLLSVIGTQPLLCKAVVDSFVIHLIIIVKVESKFIQCIIINKYVFTRDQE